ncbi:hypothetical protein Trydic_g9796 [Trypoxylus dichotomus]
MYFVAPVPLLPSVVLLGGIFFNSLRSTRFRNFPDYDLSNFGVSFAITSAARCRIRYSFVSCADAFPQSIYGIPNTTPIEAEEFQTKVPPLPRSAASSGPIDRELNVGRFDNSPSQVVYCDREWIYGEDGDERKEKEVGRIGSEFE